MIVCIAVDDEPKALEVLSIHAAKAPEMQLVRTFTNPQEALAWLKDNFVDLIFLDINMPGISGLEFIGKLQSKPYIIFTTAYSEYAIESYDLEAVDYLLKPIEFDRFHKAVSKVKRQVQLNSIQQDSLLSKFIFVKDGYKQVKISIDEILYIQSEGNYLNIVTAKEKVLVRMTFPFLMEKLPRNLFFRIHNSYVINLSHIRKIEDNHIFIHQVKIPLGIKYKDPFLSFLNLT